MIDEYGIPYSIKQYHRFPIPKEIFIGIVVLFLICMTTYVLIKHIKNVREKRNRDGDMAVLFIINKLPEDEESDLICWHCNEPTMKGDVYCRKCGKKLCLRD